MAKDDEQAGSGGIPREERRRNRRIARGFSVELLALAERVRVMASNLGPDGVFLEMDSPPKVGQRVKMMLHFLGQDTGLFAVGDVIWRRGEPLGEGLPAGAGIRFHVMDTRTRRIWTAFVDALLGQVYASEHPERARRIAPRAESHAVGVLIHGERSERVVARDLSTGGAFIETPLRVAEGEAITLALVHPELSFELTLEGEVIQARRRPGETPGLGIRFVGMSEQTQALLQRFLFGALQPGG